MKSSKVIYQKSYCVHLFNFQINVHSCIGLGDQVSSSDIRSPTPHLPPPAAHPSFHVNWNPQQRMCPLTQPICLLSPDNQPHHAARGNRSPGHVSLSSLSCNRICSQAPTTPPPHHPLLFIHLYTSYSHPSFLQNQLIHMCILHISHHFLFTRHDKDGGQT